MLARLKEAYYRAHGGHEEARLVERIERELDAFPAGALSQPWIEWFWSLPPEAWDGVLQHRKECDALEKVRFKVVRAIARPGKLRRRNASPEAIAEAEATLEKVEKGVLAMERSIRETRASVAGRWGEPPPNLSPFVEVPNGLPVDTRSSRWDEWIASLPASRREEGRALWRLDEENLTHKKLVIAAITSKNKLLAEGANEETIRNAEAEINALRPEIDRLLLAYRRASAPLFAEFGNVDLAGCRNEGA